MNKNLLKYCPQCGKTLSFQIINLEGDIPYCKVCDKLYFPHDATCIIALIKYQNKLLLIKQGYLGYQHCLVAGHVKSGANLETTLKEEIQEEVGLNLITSHYLGSYYHENSTNLMVGFFAECTGVITINEEVDDFSLMDKDAALEALNGRSAGSYFLNIAIEKGLI